MRDKIALEEHVSTEAMNALWDDAGEASGNGKDYMDWVEERLLDIPKRLRHMDECGIATTILSMTSPGVQGIVDADLAVSSAKDTNDTIYRTFVEPYPEQFAFFACVRLQDPDAAAEELQRSVSVLGAKGALVNGYTNVGGTDAARHLDSPRTTRSGRRRLSWAFRSTFIPGSPFRASYVSTRATPHWSGRPGHSDTRPRRTRYA
jgi:predicted TIM-barrel fold metal-dependent hydrolase